MVAEAAAVAEVFIQQTLSAQYQICVPHPTGMEVASPSSILSMSPSILPASESPFSIEVCRTESAFGCSTSMQASSVDTKNSKLLTIIRSGSHTDIGPRRCNEDEHVQIDDVSAHLGSLYRWPLPSSFYAVFDGHGGSGAATYVKNNAVKFFLDDAISPKKTGFDEAFLEELECSQRKAFLLADQALAEECSVDVSCGTTALTALVIGRHLLVANAGDCRAVLCRKGIAVQMSRDHRPSCALEQKRVEDMGGFIEYGYLNGELSVTRALGDMFLKLPYGSTCPLTAEPEVQHALLTEDDEFLILGCDGIWDVMSNQEAVSLVRRQLRLHNDPQRSARELVRQALCRDTCDNLTVIVVCFTSPDRQEVVSSQRPRLRCCSLSDEARLKLRSLFEAN